MTFDPDAAASDGAGIYGLPFTADDAHVIVIPVPYEATTSYGGGTSRGPEAVFEASKQVDHFDRETGRPYEAGIAMLEVPKNISRLNEKAKHIAAAVIEKGGIVDNATRKAASEVNAISEEVNDWVYEQTRAFLVAGKMPVVLGGDHSVPFGAILAYAETHPNLGILHLDAHADLRDAYEGFTWSHASIMFNVVQRLPGVAKLVQVGIRDVGEAEAELIDTRDDRIATYFDADVAQQKMDGMPWNQLVDRMVQRLPQQVYLSFDIDGLDPTLCPHTGTPVPGGLSFQEAVSLVAGVVRSGRKIVGLDLMEVAPGPDGDEWDGNVAARLLYKMIGYALKSQRK